MTYFKILYASMAVIFFLGISRTTYSWDGPYAGLILGYDSSSFKFSSGSEVGFSKAQSGTMAFNGLGEEMVAGWGKLFDKYYAGIEAFASLSEARGKSSSSHDTGLIGGSNTFTTKITKKHSYGIAVRGGYKVHEKTLLFAKMGVLSSKFNLNLVNINTPEVSENFSINSYKDLTGFMMGIGAEIRLTDWLLGRFEASHTEYSKKKIARNPSGSFINASFRPQSNEVKIGAIVLIK